MGAAYPKSIVTVREQQKPQKDLTDWCRMGWPGNLMQLLWIPSSATSWCTPYGYQLNQQGNKFEATEDAKWVKLIYQWYLAGVSTNEIARRLEFLEVARPNERLNRKLHEGDPMSFKVPDRLLTDGQCRMMINGIQFIQALLEANELAVGKDHQFKGRYEAEKNAVIISLEKDEREW